MNNRPAIIEHPDSRAFDLRRHITDAAIAESLLPPLAEKFLASLARVEAARNQAMKKDAGDKTQTLPRTDTLVTRDHGA